MIARVLPITNFQAPELEPYRTMKRPVEHRQQGIFVAEGEKVVRRLLESNFEVISVLLPPKWLDPYRPLVEARPETLTVYTADKAVLEQLTGFSMYQGLLAVGRIPRCPTLDEVLAQSASPRLLVAIDALTNAENLGVLVRNTVAFGGNGLLVGETSSSPYLRRAVRNSMGAIFQLPVVELSSLAATIRDLRSREIRCIAAHPHASGRSLTAADFTRDCCIVLGSEGYGISPMVLEGCHEAVAIPMAGSVDSLNVGSAGAIFLYEANRQRGRM